MSTSPAHASKKLPEVWLLASPHAGDNTQLRAITQALAWPTKELTLSFKRRETLLRFLNWPSVSGLSAESQKQLSPPWPDLVLCAGRANEAVARWIRQQSQQAAKVVFVGSPWADPSQFDLVIATPQYGVEAGPTVLNIPLPIHGLTPALLSKAAREMAPRVAHLPRPHIAVLVGGSSGPYVFDAASARRLGLAASHMAQSRGGSLLVTTSPRTSPGSIDALRHTLTAPHSLHLWQKQQNESPLAAYLALADEIIVTADSISMISEACSTAKPVHLFDYESGPFAMRDGGGPIALRGRTIEATAFRILMRLAPPRWSRDLRIVHRAVVDQGLATWLGEPPNPRRASAEPSLALVTARIKSIYGL